MTPATSRTPLTLDRIVDAAIELIEAEGPEGLSMRRLAERLGSSTMATYHHVADRQALMEAIAQRLLAELTPGPADGDWRQVVVTQIAEYLALSRRHPATFATLLRSRPTALVTQVAHIVDDLTNAGLDETTAQLVVRTTVRYLMGTVLSEGAADRSVITQADLDELFSFGLRVLLAGFDHALEDGPALENGPALEDGAPGATAAGR
ncbi:MAG: TetR/AcrR family transcriptional regulator [Microthrixaceae bacterium]